VAFDPEHRLVLSVVPGARDAESVEAVVSDTKERTGGRVMDLMTSDDYPAYETAILDAYGQEYSGPQMVDHSSHLHLLRLFPSQPPCVVAR
jgi:hypothetical protein